MQIYSYVKQGMALCGTAVWERVPELWTQKEVTMFQQLQRTIRVTVLSAVIAVTLFTSSAPAHASFLSLPIANLEGEFTAFSIPDGLGGTISTGTWNVQQNGSGTWLFDSATGINTFTVDLLAVFPNLLGTPTVQLTTTESGPFKFAREDATGIVSVWTANTGSGSVAAPGTPFDGTLFAFNNNNDLGPVPIKPIIPIAPPTTPTLPPMPTGFTALAAGSLPQLSEVGTSGVFALSAVLDVPGVAGQQQFQGTGSFTVVPEPSTLLMLTTGLAGLLGYGRRRKRAAECFSSERVEL